MAGEAAPQPIGAMDPHGTTNHLKAKMNFGTAISDVLLILPARL